MTAIPREAEAAIKVKKKEKAKLTPRSEVNNSDQHSAGRDRRKTLKAYASRDCGAWNLQP
jgi:hypothetical protein